MIFISGEKKTQLERLCQFMEYKDHHGEVLADVESVESCVSLTRRSAVRLRWEF